MATTGAAMTAVKMPRRSPTAVLLAALMVKMRLGVVVWVVAVVVVTVAAITAVVATAAVSSPHHLSQRWAGSGTVASDRSAFELAAELRWDEEIAAAATPAAGGRVGGGRRSRVHGASTRPLSHVAR